MQVGEKFDYSGLALQRQSLSKDVNGWSSKEDFGLFSDFTFAPDFSQEMGKFAVYISGNFHSKFVT
jgi:hypothetical protein